MDSQFFGRARRTCILSTIHRSFFETMEEKEKNIVELLHIAGETHHAVYLKEEGNDPDWASWYSNWLIDHSNLKNVLGTIPVRSELTYLLVKLDKDYQIKKPDTPWQEQYAEEILKHFS